jgi:SAM-dependent methyltransferase
MRSFNYTGLFRDFVRSKAARRLRVLEINEAGNLTAYLARIPGHVLKLYPQIDIMCLDFPDQYFDLVVHSDTLEHVEDPVKALAECRRVLRPGKFCCFTVPMIVDRLTLFRRGLPPSYHGVEEEQRPDFLVRTEYGCDAWKHVIQAGFSECRIHSLDYPAAHALVGVKS